MLLRKTLNIIRENKADAIFVFLLSVFFVFEIMRLGEYPGLYSDAMQPDYASIQYIFQQSHSQSFFGVVDNY